MPASETLGPGSYRLTAIPTANHGTGNAKSISFTLLP